MIRRSAARDGTDRSWPKWLSPIVVFPALWVVGAALAQIPVLEVQRPFSLTTWVVVALVPASFVAGGLIGKELVAELRLRRARTAPTISRRLLAVLAAFAGIGSLELVHQWVTAGRIPLLSGAIDEARTSQLGGPTIILTDFLTVAIVVALATPSSLKSRHAVAPLAIAGAGLCGFALQGGRGPLVLPVAVAFLVRAFLWHRPRRGAVLAAAAAFVLLTSGVFYARTDQDRSSPFQRELNAEVLPATPRLLQPLLPLQLGIATNFTALNGVVDHFPDGSPYGHGVYSAHGLDLFIPSARDLEDVTARLTPPWVTSTAAGPLWADGGPVLVVIGMALIGAMVQGSYAAALRMRSMSSTLVAAYLSYMAFFGLYANLWTQNADWILVVPLLLLTGALADAQMPFPRIVSAIRTRGRPA